MNDFTNAVATQSGISVTTIIAIISSIITMVEGCSANTPTAALTPAEVMTDTIMNRIIVNRAVRDNGIRPLSAEGQKLINTIIENAKTASPTDVAQFISLCE